MDNTKEQVESKFDHISLEEESDGSVADVEDDPTTDFPKGKSAKKKKMKKKKIFFRSDFTGEQESSSDEDDASEKPKTPGIIDKNPVCKILKIKRKKFLIFKKEKSA